MHSSRRRLRLWDLLVLLPALALAPAAQAYRPFDSTDAAVAAPGEFELELGPLGRLREGAARTLVAPAVVANFGIEGGREIVLQGQRQVPLGDGLGSDPPGRRAAVTDTGLFLKQVLRPGTLQDEAGPSIATEYGVLLPTYHGEPGAGLSAAAIVSQRSPLGTVHFNSVLSLTRSHRADLFLGGVVEGPDAWTVRPVAELFAEQERGGVRTVSRLAGAIWRVSESLSFDLGLRQAHVGSEVVREVRLGLTWAFPWRR